MGVWPTDPRPRGRGYRQAPRSGSIRAEARTTNEDLLGRRDRTCAPGSPVSVRSPPSTLGGRPGRGRGGWGTPRAEAPAQPQPPHPRPAARRRRRPRPLPFALRLGEGKSRALARSLAFGPGGQSHCVALPPPPGGSSIAIGQPCPSGSGLGSDNASHHSPLTTFAAARRQPRPPLDGSACVRVDSRFPSAFTFTFIPPPRGTCEQLTAKFRRR
jgi:hypothetical protein